VREAHPLGRKTLILKSGGLMADDGECPCRLAASFFIETDGDSERLLTFRDVDPDVIFI
jgi:hypothetical protein